MDAEPYSPRRLGALDLISRGQGDNSSKSKPFALLFLNFAEKKITIFYVTADDLH
jgi:hypothetical protein